MYEAAIKEAKGKGESSKVRRYTRAAETIKSLQKKVCRDLCGLWSVWSVVCGLLSVVCGLCGLSSVWSVVCVVCGQLFLSLRHRRERQWT